jgi:hypothetical protein
MIVKDAMNSYAATLDRAWAHDRTQTVGASEVGGCMRHTYYLKNENDPKFGVARDSDYVDSWGAKLRGTLMENHFWAPAMKAKYGDKLLLSGPDQESFVIGFLSATPDGMLIDLPVDFLAANGIPELDCDCIMAESKTIDPRSNLIEAKPRNIFQTHVQMGIVRELTPYKPGYSLLSYTNASFWDQVTEFPIKFDPEIYAVAKSRAAMVMTATSAKDLEPEGYLAGGKDCQYCPFTGACGVVRMSVPTNPEKTVDLQLVAEFADMAKEISVLEKTVDADEIRLRTLKQALKDRLREKNIRKIPGVVSWSSVKGRASYDNNAIQAAAIAAGVDIEQFKKVGDSTDRMTVTGEAA